MCSICQQLEVVQLSSLPGGSVFIIRHIETSFPTPIQAFNKGLLATSKTYSSENNTHRFLEFYLLDRTSFCIAALGCCLNFYMREFVLYYLFDSNLFTLTCLVRHPKSSPTRLARFFSKLENQHLMSADVRANSYVRARLSSASSHPLIPLFPLISPDIKAQL